MFRCGTRSAFDATAMPENFASKWYLNYSYGFFSFAFYGDKQKNNRLKNIRGGQLKQNPKSITGTYDGNVIRAFHGRYSNQMQSKFPLRHDYKWRSKPW